MKYLMRLLVMILYVIGYILIVSGFMIFMLLFLVQIPIWFIWKGELPEEDEIWPDWYVKNVPGLAEDLLERIMERVK